MAQEFSSREKKVQKMTREGLVEENLSDHKPKHKNSQYKESSPEPPVRAAPVRSGIDDHISYDRKGEMIAESETQLGDADLNKKKKRIRSHHQELYGTADRVQPSGEAVASKVEASRKAIRRAQKSLEDQEENEDDVPNKLREYESVPGDVGIGISREALKRKQEKRRTSNEQKKSGRLSFEDETDKMVSGAGTGFRRNVSDISKGDESAGKASSVLRDAQLRANRSDGKMQRASIRMSEDIPKSRLRFEESAKAASAKEIAQKQSAEAARKKEINRFWQKKRYKKAYAAAKAGKASAGGGVVTASGAITESITEKAKRVARQIFVRNSSVFVTIGLLALIFVLMVVSLSSCSASIAGSGAFVRITSYTATDEDIYAAENAYRELENQLNEQINSVETRHSGYDRYQYQIDEITHNPYQLISYLTAKYGTWTYEQVEEEIPQIFAQQYHLTTEATQANTTTTRRVRVGESLGQVVTSGYCNCSICCGVWSGGPTASGAMPRANHTIAVDARNPFVPMGTKVVMNGVEYTVEDTGAFARYGVQFDVYYDSHSAASAHGHKTWEAYIADDNGSREVEVTVVETESVYSVTLTNNGIDAVARENLDTKGMLLYNTLNTTLGNRDYLWDLTTISNNGGGSDYQIPPEALSDERFANMIHEAERHLGTPYVWGGYSPSGFDCSGFVSWVINHCGNGWNYGRLTAEGLRGVCVRVSPENAKPGDLIFFQGTYDTPGASHIGIYVGNGMMIHCGKPVQYTSINTSYWQQHFMQFGRLP